MIQQQEHDQYTLIVIKNDSLDEAQLTELNEQIVIAMEAGATNFILDVSGIKEIPADSFHKLEMMHQIILKENGMLVVCEAGHEAEDRLKELEIVTTPTLDEATDYIFMEEIERQLLSGDMEDDDLDL